MNGSNQREEIEEEEEKKKNEIKNEISPQLQEPWKMSLNEFIKHSSNDFNIHTYEIDDNGGNDTNQQRTEDGTTSTTSSTMLQDLLPDLFEAVLAWIDQQSKQDKLQKQHKNGSDANNRNKPPLLSSQEQLQLYGYYKCIKEGHAERDTQITRNMIFHPVARAKAQAWKDASIHLANITKEVESPTTKSSERDFSFTQHAMKAYIELLMQRPDSVGTECRQVLRHSIQQHQSKTQTQTETKASVSNHLSTERLSIQQQQQQEDISNSSTCIPDLAPATTFRDDVRQEWIQAILSPFSSECDPNTNNNNKTSLNDEGYAAAIQEGIGLAKIAPSQTYSVSINLQETFSTAGTTNGNINKNKMNTNDRPKTLTPKLGLSLARLSLGLYVREVHSGSDAWCAGILPNSVLVAINGMNLLAEPSQHALERIWQHYEDRLSSTMLTKSENLSKKSSQEQHNHHTNIDGDDGDRGTNTNTLRSPIHMTLIRHGQLYDALLLSNPSNYGIDWAPCGNFSIVQSVSGLAKLAGIQAGSFVADIHMDNSSEGDKDNTKTTIRPILATTMMDHDEVSSVLPQILQNAESLTNTNSSVLPVVLSMTFIVLPPEARSGHWERTRQEQMTKSHSEQQTESIHSLEQLEKKDPTISDQVSGDASLRHRRRRKSSGRPQVAAQLDGVQVRVHSLWSAASTPQASTNTNLNGSASNSLSQIAMRVAAGEFWSFSTLPTQDNGVSRPHLYSGPASSLSSSSPQNPTLDQPMTQILTIDRALGYILYFDQAKYNEECLNTEHLSFGHSSVLSFFEECEATAEPQHATGISIQKFLLPILALLHNSVIEKTSGLVLNEKGVESLIYVLTDACQQNVSLCHEMIFVAQALELEDLKEKLVCIRKDVNSASMISTQQIMLEGSSQSEGHQDQPLSPLDVGMIVSATTSTADSSYIQPTELLKSSSSSSRKRILGIFKRKKNASIRNTASSDKATFSIEQPNSSARIRKSVGSRKGKGGLKFKKSSPRKLKHKESTNSHVKQIDLFAQTIEFIDELDSICAEIEKSLMRSFSQKIAAWALQPWSASKDMELAKVTEIMRERLRNGSAIPLLNPIRSEERLLSIDAQGSYILPSAHFPLLLTFDCQNSYTGTIDDKNNSCPFGSQEFLYRTKVELVDLAGTSLGQSEQSKGYVYTAQGAIGGMIASSGPSIATNRKQNQHAWDQGNILKFEYRSSWGAPNALILMIKKIDENNKSSTEHELLADESKIGQCTTDLSDLWSQVDNNPSSTLKNKVTKTYELRLGVCLFSEDFDEHGGLIVNKEEEGLEEDIDLQIRVTAEKIPLTGNGGLWSRKRSLLYKHDDDLRQERFAIEFINTCDSILKANGLDMELLTFQCIPVGPTRGFIEWIQGAVSLSEICQPFSDSLLGGENKTNPKSVNDDVVLDDTSITVKQRNPKSSSLEKDPLSTAAKAGLTKYESLYQDKVSSNGSNPIQNFFRAFHYDLNQPYMIPKEVMDRYIKSCAGYCVITYLLGVGDRHLDNLLLHPTGHFFHCDFSFLLGQDPKKYLPVRMTEEMVQGMGGRESDNYAKFQSLIGSSFLTLRRPENVRHIMSFLRLMGGFVITSPLGNESSAERLERNLIEMRGRLRLELTDNEAITFMEDLIEESCSSKMWMAVDAMHSLGKRF